MRMRKMQNAGKRYLPWAWNATVHELMKEATQEAAIPNVPIAVSVSSDIPKGFDGKQRRVNKRV